MIAAPPQVRDPARHRNGVGRATDTATQPPQPVPSSSPRNFPEPPLVLTDRKGGARYSRGGILGEGGFARCYEAIDATGVRFACKVIPKASLKTSKQKQKLIAEIRVHQLMSHPNIVGFKHVFEDDDFVYMILELCENRTFVEMLRKRRRLTEAEVRHWMWQLLDAVRDVHRRGVIHRDLKLGNLFITRDMKLKLGDFGLAAMIKHDGERKKTICGTPNYIAPEVLFDTQTGHSFEVDIWSLGVVMYTLLIGKPPFQTKDVKAIYKKIRDNAYDFPEQVKLSDASKNVITSLLQSRPEHRPSVDDIMHHAFFTVQAPLRSLPVSALTTIPDLPEPVPTPSPLPSPPPRRPPLGENLPIRDNRTVRAVTSKESLKFRSSIESPVANSKTATPSAGSQASSKDANKDLVKNFQHMKIESSENPNSASLPTPEPDSREDSGNSAAPAKRNTSRSSSGSRREADRAPPSPSHSNQSKSAEAPEAPPKEAPPSQPLRISTSPASSRTDAYQSTQSPRPPESPRKTVNILASMYRNLHDALSGKNISRADSHSEGEVVPPRIFITKWIDYSNKYGLGYQLRDESVGVYFNDSTSMILAADNHHFEYLYYERGSDRTVMHRKAFTLTQYPSDLQKKVTLLKHFRGYMQEKLFKACKQPDDVVPKTQNLDFLTKYLRTKHGVIFRLSNHVVQLNLFDHSKVILSDDGLAVTYIDHNRVFTTRRLEDFVASGSKDIMDRLKYLREVLHQMLLKKKGRSEGNGTGSKD
ncbi:kinase-like domain-containing protein [Gaertneriomyces semiglobifer]|nr:kinase-like domain-containing protein [Gaertneriomyces semiglobifer]